MLSRAQVASFGRDGFVNGGTVLGAAELAALSTDLDRVLSLGPRHFEEAHCNDPTARRPAIFRDIGPDTEGDTGKRSSGGEVRPNTVGLSCVDAPAAQRPGRRTHTACMSGGGRCGRWSTYGRCRSRSAGWPTTRLSAPW